MAYCRVAMETNLPASLSLSVLRFAWEFVLLQIFVSDAKNRDETSLTGHHF